MEEVLLESPRVNGHRATVLSLEDNSIGSYLFFATTKKIRGKSVE
jgi:hypothetical protein